MSVPIRKVSSMRNSRAYSFFSLLSPVWGILFLGCSESDGFEGPADSGRSDGMEVGVPDLGPDGGSARQEMGSTDVGGETGFRLGAFDPDWSNQEATRMFWGLADEACFRFRSTDGSEFARAEVRLQEGFSNETYNWRFGRDGEAFFAWEDRFRVSSRELRLEGRSQEDDALRESTTYGGINSSPPVAARVDGGNDLTASSFESQSVEGVRVRVPGVSQSLAQDHVFTFTAISVDVAEQSFSGFEVVHQVDGAAVARYDLIPAFGVVGFQLDGTGYELCDFRICTSTGCEGQPSCDMLNCGD